VISHRRTHIGASVAYATLAAITGGLVLSSADVLPDLGLRDPGLTAVAQDTGVPEPESSTAGTRRDRPRHEQQPQPTVLLPTPVSSVCSVSETVCIASAMLLPDVLLGYPVTVRHQPRDGVEAPSAPGQPSADEAETTDGAGVTAVPPVVEPPPVTVTTDPATDPPAAEPTVTAGPTEPTGPIEPTDAGPSSEPSPEPTATDAPTDGTTTPTPSTVSPTPEATPSAQVPNTPLLPDQLVE
jgi:hypothetical protein